MKLATLLTDSLKIPVDFSFIKQVVGGAAKMKMMDYENFNAKTTLASIFGGHDCVCILFHLIENGRVTPVGHWCVLIKGTPIKFFDSLGMGLRKILATTHEKPWLLKLLKKVKYEDSNVALQTQGERF